MAHKLKCTVICKEFLNTNAPVRSKLENPIVFRGQTNITAPRVDILQLLKCSRTNQHIQTVFTETPEQNEKRGMIVRQYELMIKNIKREEIKRTFVFEPAAASISTENDLQPSTAHSTV